MADPARDLDRGLAARLRWAAMVLGSAMMMVGLACFLAISASKKSGRASTISSLFLLQFFQNLGTFFSVYPLGALTILMFIARACTYCRSRSGGRRVYGVGLPLVEWRISGHGSPGEGVQGGGEAMAVTSTGERGLQRGDEEEIAETRAVDIEECLPRTLDTAKGRRIALANP